MTNYVRNNRGTRKANATKARNFIGPWFRVYAADIDDYRVQSLPVQVRWIWFELSCIAATRNGTLPDNDQMAFRLRRAPHEVAAAIDVLISNGLVIQSCMPGEEPTLRMAGWDDRQYVADLSTQRVRRLRERRRRGVTGETANETFHATSHETVKLSSHSHLPSTLEDRYHLSIQEEDVDGSCLGDTCEGGAA